MTRRTFMPAMPMWAFIRGAVGAAIPPPPGQHIGTCETQPLTLFSGDPASPFPPTPPARRNLRPCSLATLPPPSPPHYLRDAAFNLVLRRVIFGRQRGELGRVEQELLVPEWGSGKGRLALQCWSLHRTAEWGEAGEGGQVGVSRLAWRVA